MFRNCSRILRIKAIRYNYRNINNAINYNISTICQKTSYSSTAAIKKSQKDKFQDLINELVEENTPSGTIYSNGFAKNLKNLKTIDEVKEVVEKNRPSTTEDVLHLLMKLDNLFSNSGQKKQILKYLTSDECSSTLYAHLLSDEVKLVSLLASANIILKLLNKLPVAFSEISNDEVLSITPKFNVFYSTLINKHVIKKLNEGDISAIPAEIIISFYCKLMNLSGELDKNIQNVVENIVIRKVSELQQPNLIVSLLKSLKKEQFSQLNFITPIFNKLEELIPVMLLGELINVMSTLAANKCRPHALLQIIGEGIRNHTEIMIPGQLVRLGNAIGDLSFYYPRLVTRYCNDFTTNIDQFTDIEQITSIISMLVKGKVTSEKTWKALCQWISKNHKTASHIEMRYCIGALAAANVDPNLVKSFTKPFSMSLQPSGKESPKKWLSLIWSLAVLESLTPKLADSVLKENFEKALLNEISNEDEKVYNIQKLYQVNAAAKYDLENYRGTLKDTGINVDKNVCMKLKYGKIMSPYETFLKHMNIIITPDCRQSSTFYPEFGTFIDFITMFDQNSNKFVPLKDIPKESDKPLNGYTAVLYFHNQFTRIYSDEDGNARRLPGQFQMSIRHLQQSGANVCIIAEHDLQKCEDIYKRIIYIKQMITEPKDTYYYAPNWMDLK